MLQTIKEVAEDTKPPLPPIAQTRATEKLVEPIVLKNEVNKDKNPGPSPFGIYEPIIETKEKSKVSPLHAIPKEASMQSLAINSTRADPAPQNSFQSSVKARPVVENKRMSILLKKKGAPILKPIANKDQPPAQPKDNQSKQSFNILNRLRGNQSTSEPPTESRAKPTSINYMQQIQKQQEQL